MTNTKFMGYRRENGAVGIRNHVVILPLDDLSNTAAEGVAKLIEGTIALPHPYGRLQFGEDLELLFRTLIGTGANPNVAACIVIGIEPNWTNRVVEGIAETGKPVAGFSIEGYGDLKTIERAARQAVEFVQYATELQKKECDISELILSIKCGESDTTSGLAGNPSLGNALDRLIDMGATVIFGETSELTGGEHLVAARCATPEVREAFMKSFNSYNEFIVSQGVDLLGSQPTEGNIKGGLTTIEEKALGNIQKLGKRSLIQGTLAPAEKPTGKGLYYMETSSAAAECITLQVAAGSVLHFFVTGQGNIVGHPVTPVIKISANPKTVSTMSEHIDVDLSGLLRREMNLEEAGTKILECMLRTLNGRFTKAEALGHKEFVLTKLYRSA